MSLRGNRLPEVEVYARLGAQSSKSGVPLDLPCHGSQHCLGVSDEPLKSEPDENRDRRARLKARAPENHRTTPRRALRDVVSRTGIEPTHQRTRTLLLLEIGSGESRSGFSD